MIRHAFKFSVILFLFALAVCLDILVLMSLFWAKPYVKCWYVSALMPGLPQPENLATLRETVPKGGKKKERPSVKHSSYD